MTRIPGFHPGYLGSIPGQGIKILLHANAHCCLSEINTLGRLTTSKKEEVTSAIGRRFRSAADSPPLGVELGSLMEVGGGVPTAIIQRIESLRNSSHLFF